MAPDRILCSVYYPHSNLGVLARDGILPIFDLLHARKKIRAFRYFLSMHKGENIVLMWYPVDQNQKDFLKRMIETKINDFLLKSIAEYKEETFPLSRIFLNIQPNTVHFWDHDPFSDWRLFNNNEDAEIRIRSIISHLCLIEVSKTNNLEIEEISTLYFQLLLIFLRENDKSGNGQFEHFIEKLLDTIKEMKQDSLFEINRVQGIAQQRYRQYEDDYTNLIISLASKIDTEENKPGNTTIIEKWKSAIHDAVKVKGRESPTMSDEFMVQLFIIISQKISLRIDRLITSIVIFNELKSRIK